MGMMIQTAFGSKDERPKVRFDTRAAVDAIYPAEYLEALRQHLAAGGYVNWKFDFPEHARSVAVDLLAAVGIQLPAGARATASKKRNSVSSELELPLSLLHLVPAKYHQEITKVERRGDRFFKIYVNSHNFGLLRYFPQLFTLDTTQGVFGE